MRGGGVGNVVGEVEVGGDEVGGKEKKGVLQVSGRTAMREHDRDHEGPVDLAA